ncbi:MAG: TIGR00725 family protein [Spirochaetes bacterium]|nr:TIGR00725 family protein [Spirochaetota bacterium]
MRKKQVTVIGSSDENAHSEEARAIGAFIAKNGFVLITGGRGGVMEAASRGAMEQGGTVIGILPGEDPGGANRYCSVVIPTGIGFARNAVNILAADIVVAIGGRSGTLSELAYARIYGKPVVCCTFAGGWSAEFPRVKVYDYRYRDGEMMIASNVEEACSAIGKLLGLGR